MADRERPFTVGIDETELVHILGMEDPRQSLEWLLRRVREQLTEIRVVQRELNEDSPVLQQEVRAEAVRLAGLRRKIEKAIADRDGPQVVP